MQKAEWGTAAAALRFRNAGFTIVELLIVVVVIAILASITIMSYNGIQQQSRDSTRDEILQTLKKGLEMYAVDNNGQYPNACGNYSGCNITNLASSLTPTYISTIPANPMPSRPMQYVLDTSNKGYGLYAAYEAKPICKYMGGPNTNSGWWGVSVPSC